jgi:hypothetical protein
LIDVDGGDRGALPVASGVLLPGVVVVAAVGGGGGVR